MEKNAIRFRGRKIEVAWYQNRNVWASSGAKERLFNLEYGGGM